MPKTIENRPKRRTLARLDLRPGDVAASLPITTFQADYPPGAELAPHRHRRGQLIYAASGIMTVTAAEGAWVVPPTQALWMPPRLTHTIRMSGRVAMRTVYLNAAAADGMPDAPRVLAVTPLLRELILRAMDMPARYRADSPAGRMAALILDELRLLPSLPLRLPLPKDERLLRLARLLLAQPGEARKLPELARLAGASARNLARLFQAELGMSFTAWRRQARLMEALRRLAAGDAVTAIALDLGYATPSAFTYMFHRAMGVPPSRFQPASASVRTGR